MKKWEVTVDYPSDVMVIEADSEDEAIEKAFGLATTEFSPHRECTAEAELIENGDPGAESFAS